MSKIVFVINEFNSLYDFRKEFVNAIIEMKHDVFIIGPKSGKYSFFEKLGCATIFVDLERKGKSVLNDLKYKGQLRKHIKQIRPDLVFSYSMKPNMYVGDICAKYKIPHIATVTGLGMAFKINKVVSFALKLVLRNSFKKTKIVFCQNPSDAKFLLKHRIVVKEKIRVVSGSGVNLEEHHFMTYPKTENTIILYAGRVVKNKGINELLEAFDEVSKNCKTIYLNIIGHIDNEEYKQILKKYADSNDRIHYLGFSDCVDDFIKKSSAVIVPSYSEGMSNILQESLAIGRPVLASNIPGCKEICIDGKTGILFEAKNTNSLLAALNKFLSLPLEERARLGQNGREHVEKYFDRNNVLNQYLNCLKKYC